MSFTTIRYSSALENRRTSDYTANPGLLEEVDGYYDWAGRRLFLADRSPDPMTPGAYRYQTRPDLCDLAAPDSDPASPYYEPPHLRHQPGDTWIIDHDRPYDPDDPGPFGSVGWRQDRRTGRHRRNELPDPIPPWEQEAANAEPPTSSNWETAASSPSMSGGKEAASSEPPMSGGSVPPRRPGRRTSVQSPEPDGPRAGGPRSSGWSDRVEPDDSSPSPLRSATSPSGRKKRRTPQPWPEAECRPAEDKSGPSSRSGRTGLFGQTGATDRADRVDRVDGAGPAGGAGPTHATDPTGDEPYWFGKLREEAWDRFVIDSAVLAAAHQSRSAALERESGPIISRWVRFVRRGISAIRGAAWA